MRKFPGELFTKSELRQLQFLDSPVKIQNYLDSLPMNFADQDPCLSVRGVLKEKTAHCFEGALLSAAALWFHGQPPLLLDLTTTKNDEDHVVAVFKVGGCWGAISKTNHAVLRFREPVYSTLRELVMSYFHEYFLDSGQKTLRTYSKPFDLSRYSKFNWLTAQDGIMDLIQALSDSPHYKILHQSQIKKLRPADGVEIAAGKIVEWRKPRGFKE